jgi:uncharacterized protein YqeY
MSLHAVGTADLNEALNAREEIKVSTLRMLKASLKNREIEKMAALTDEDIISVLSSTVKQRRESIEQYAAAGRDDFVSREKQEIAIILCIPA